MQKPNLQTCKWNIIFSGIALLVVIFDQLTKFWIRTNLPFGDSIPPSGFFRLTHAQNTGAAFSLFYGKVSILSAISIIGVIIILVYVFVLYRHFSSLDTRLNKVALGLILGGTIGNLIDRLYFKSVTDFIDIGPWPVFNLADSSVVVGVIIFAFSILITYRSDKEHHV
jgi:signal peptidase II